MPRIYLDNAATSFPKPPGVWEAVLRAGRDLGAPLGRGASREALEVARLVDQGRRRIADLLHAEDAGRILFTFNGTDSLNLALHGLLGPGDHVVASVLEHNSVLRPLRELERRCGVETTYVRADSRGVVRPDDFRAALRPNTKLCALVHASNVTGALQPAAEVARIAREAGVLCLLDAAQTAGSWPIDLRELPVDLLAAPGHKGLLGPLGTGLLYVRPGVEARLRGLRQGGTGTQSELDLQPDTLPDKYEAGNHNVPGLCGLVAGVEYLLTHGVAAVRDHERQRMQELQDGLAGLPGVTCHGPADAAERVGTLSITVDGWEPHDLATVLEDAGGVQTRAGFHCAPRTHAALGTAACGGTLRFSVGPFTTAEEIAACVEVLRSILG